MVITIERILWRNFPASGPAIDDDKAWSVIWVSGMFCIFDRHASPWDIRLYFAHKNSAHIDFTSGFHVVLKELVFAGISSPTPSHDHPGGRFRLCVGWSMPLKVLSLGSNSELYSSSNKSFSRNFSCSRQKQISRINFFNRGRMNY